MYRSMFGLAVAPLLLLAPPLHAQANVQTDADYLQNRAHDLSGRIAIAVRKHRLARGKGRELQIAVRKVQTEAGHLRTVQGTVGRADADRMNQSLTDVERTLTNQP